MGDELKKFQPVYQSLGINVNFEEEFAKGRILLPKEEQKQAAAEAGYTYPVLVPGYLPRQEIIHLVKKKLFNKFGSGGIYFYSDDIHLTEQAKHTLRPETFYLIYLRPNHEVNETNPETLEKTFIECQEILAKENQKNPKLNLKGLTLEEFLMAQASLDQIENAHFDSVYTAWLLEEVILDHRGKPERCLRAYFRAAAIGMSSCLPDSTRPKRGARFAVVPAFANQNIYTA